MTTTLSASAGPLAETPTPAARKRSRAALHPAWIVPIAACAVLVRMALHQGLEGDVFWQLASGQWMLAHHAVLRRDVFSYTVLGKPWVAEEWGFEVLVAWLAAHLGPTTFWWVSAAPSVGALAASVWRWRRLGASPMWMAVLTVPVAGSLIVGVAVRPQVLSYMLFALELLVLAAARRDRRWLAALPVMLLLWANLHGSFLLGLVVLALEAALAGALKYSASRRSRGLGSSGETALSFGRIRVTQALRLSDALIVLGTSLVASMVNPDGPGLFAYAFKVTESSRLASLIEEWQSPNFHSLLQLGLIVGPLVVVLGALAMSRVQLELLDLVLWLGMLLATLHAIRFLPYLGIAFGGLAAPWPVLARGTMRPRLLTAPLAALLAAVLLVGPHPAAGTPARTGPAAIPVQAAEWVSHQHGRVFSTYLWNSYLIHLGVPVFVDGRTDLYFGTGVLRAYTRLDGLSTNPDPLLSKWHVRWVLWPSGSPLAVFLSSDPRWRLVMRSGPGLLFERR